jgi:hypothetical protein
VFFPSFTPHHVLIRIITPAGETVREVYPEYEPSQPNGPECPPTCFTAYVDVDLP